MRKLLYMLIAFPMLTHATSIQSTPWPMYQQNADHTGYINSKINADKITYEWKQFVGEAPGGVVNYLSQPVVADKLIYVSRSNYVYSNTLQAFSTKDGHEVWKKTYGHVMINPPAVVNGIVYVQTVNNESPDTALYGYDATSGKILFKAPTSAQWENYLAPTVFAGNVYADGGGYGGMYSFDAKTGNQNWFSGLEQFDEWTPAVNEKYAIAYTGGHLHALDRLSGKSVVDVTDTHYSWSGYSSGFSPVLLGKDKVLGIQSGYLSLFDLVNSNVDWSIGPGFEGQPAYDGKFIYAVKNNGLIALDQSGHQAWVWFQDNENVRGQLLVTNNLIFVTTNKKTYAISKKTREPVWSYEVTGTLAMGMGHLYVLCDDGTLNSFAVKDSYE